MYALPEKTHLSHPLAKKTLFEQFALSAPQRRMIDSTISRMEIIAHLSPATLPAIATGEQVSSIYVLRLSLKQRDYDREVLSLLDRLISQQLLFVLSYESEVQLAIVQGGVHVSPWQSEESLQIPLTGLSFDALWASYVASLAQLELREEQTLAEALERKRHAERIARQIATLERKKLRTRSIARRIELRHQIRELQAQLPSPSHPRQTRSPQ